MSSMTSLELQTDIHLYKKLLSHFPCPAVSDISRYKTVAKSSDQVPKFFQSLNPLY